LLLTECTQNTAKSCKLREIRGDLQKRQLVAKFIVLVITVPSL
jgi:hypothetical protein